MPYTVALLLQYHSCDFRQPPPPSPARLPAARLDGLLEEARHAMNVSRNASMQTLQDMAGARRCR